MRRTLYTPSSTPVVSGPSPLLLFIQQSQLTLVYTSGRDGRRAILALS